MGVYVKEGLIVHTADNFTIVGSLVEGSVRIINTKSNTLADNTLDGGNLVAWGNIDSSVARNGAKLGAIPLALHFPVFLGTFS